MSNFIKQAKNYKGFETDQTPVEVDQFGSWYDVAKPDTADGNLIQQDGDTWYDTVSGEMYRLQGAYAPETTKATVGDRGELDVQYGQAGGEETAAAVHNVRKQGGFNKVVKTGERDQYGREIIRMVNDKGEDLTQTLYRAGILNPDAHSGDQQTEDWELGHFARALGVEQPYEEVAQQLEEDLLKGKPWEAISGIPAFGTTALDEQEYASQDLASDYHNTYVGDVAFDDPNRDQQNMAKNSYGASFELGWQGMKDGVYGALEILGLTELGEEGLARQEQIKAELPGVRNIDFDEVDGIGDFFQYLGNNAAMSLPYMGLIAGAAIAAPVAGLGAIGTAALGTLPAGLVYAGQTWNEMEGEKGGAQRGAALAAGFAAATVDRLGLAGIIRPTSLLTKEGKEKVIAEIIKQGKAPNREAAEALLKREGKDIAKEMFSHMGKTSDDQLAAYINTRGLSRDISQGIVGGALSEGTTEAAQELIQYGTATQFSEREFDMTELADRIRDSFIAGSTLGAGFGAGGAGWQYGDRVAAAKDLQAAELDRLTQYEQIREQHRRAGRPLETVDGILEETTKATSNWEPPKPKKGQLTGAGGFARRARKWDRTGRGFVNNLKSIRSLPEGLAKGIGGIQKLYQASTVTAFDPQELANTSYGPTLTKLRALLGQQRGVIHPGMSFEAHSDRIYGTLSSMVYTPQIMARFGVRDQFISKENRNNVSKMLREFGRDGTWDKLRKGQISKEQVPAKYRENIDALMKTAQEFEAMSDGIYKVQKDALNESGGDPDQLGYLSGWWFKNQQFDSGKIKRNKEAWYRWMRKNTDLKEDELRDFYDRLEGGQVSNIDEFFSHVAGVEYVPGSHQKRTANLSELEGFEQFAQDDIFTNMDNASRQAARYATARKYWGAGGKNLDYIFDELAEKGMPEDKLNELAWYTKSIIDAESGNFNRITDHRWAATQRFATTWSILGGLTLSTLSSLPELAMYRMGLDKKELAGSVSKAGKEIADAFVEQAQRSLDTASKEGIVKALDDNNNPVPYEQARLNKAGLAWSPSSAANRVGIGETNISTQWLTDSFFKAIGLAQLTQGQRRANSAMVTDFVANRLAELAAAPDLKSMTNREQFIYNQLAEVGIDVERMLELWTDYGNSNTVLDYAETNRDIPPEIMKEIDSNMQLAVYNFVNMRIQNPGAANRPLFFQDPHWQLLTQFNGFISTFTANVVPKLWNDYIRRGPPSVKYKTFSLIMTLMVLGAAGQYMKDWIKYGRITPYLSDPQHLQRAIYSSGVLGQGERVVDLISPLYGSRPRGLVDSIFDTVVGEAGPTVRTLGTLGGAVGKASEDPAAAAQDVAKTLPIIGPLGRWRKGLAGSLFGEGEEQFNYYDNK